MFSEVPEGKAHAMCPYELKTHAPISQSSLPPNPVEILA